MKRQKEHIMTKKQKQSRKTLLNFTQLSLLLAIEIIVCFTPLGTLPAIGSLNATLSHVPVIITALLLGEKAGAFMGFAFGACSFIYWSFVAPGIFSFIYTPLYSAGEYQGNIFSLLICFLPRILIGVVCAAVYKLMKKLKVNDTVSSITAGALASLTNTVLVLGGIWLFFGEEYLTLATDQSKALTAVLMATVVTNGIPEAVIGGLAAGFIAKPLKKMIKRYTK